MSTKQKKWYVDAGLLGSTAVFREAYPKWDEPSYDSEEEAQSVASAATEHRQRELDQKRHMIPIYAKRWLLGELRYAIMRCGPHALLGCPSDLNSVNRLLALMSMYMEESGLSFDECASICGIPFWRLENPTKTLKNRHSHNSYRLEAKFSKKAERFTQGFHKQVDKGRI